MSKGDGKALKIVYRSTAELIPYARNSRTHSDAQISQIAASIREFGWTNPVLIDEAGTVIAGHGRLLAAQRLKMDEVPTIELAGLSDSKRRALIVADNKLALNAGWDNEMLGLELAALGEVDFDLSLIGFNDAELAMYLASGDDPSADQWVDMPEFNQDDKTAHRTLPVHFANGEDVVKFAKLIGQPITEKTRSLWFPEVVIERCADKRYE